MFKVGDIIKLKKGYRSMLGPLLQVVEILKKHSYIVYDVLVIDPGDTQFQAGTILHGVTFTDILYEVEDYGFKKDLQELLDE